jgi:uncharacterized protein with ParB-like and HNH nuclease domain
MAEQIESDEIGVDDEGDEGEHFVPFDLNIYPSDYTLKGIQELWSDGDIEVPDFQRNFVWTIKQSSLLIESFLLGLPVPQAFFFVDDQERRLVIDGLQRISSIVFYLDGYFGPENNQGKRQVFRLTGLDEKSPYAKKRFVDLSDADQRKLKNTVLRVVNIRQLAPQKGDTSMYYIFERLNTGGTPLRPQEIRNCVFSGKIVTELRRLNALGSWRKILGRIKPEKHQRDVEILLRVFAFYTDSKSYEKPMKDFLNRAMLLHRECDTKLWHDFESIFATVCERIIDELGERPFHVRGPINLAALDSIFLALLENPKCRPNDLRAAVNELYARKDYQSLIYFNTSDTSTVKDRLKIVRAVLHK